MPRYGMLIDLRRCVGCFACVMACKAEHATPKGVSWNRVVVEEKGEYPKARMTFTPMLCNHCANPPCQEVCPTGATYKRPDGIVAVDQHQCIGCKYCMVACPYQARSFNEKTAGYFPEWGLTPLEKQGYSQHISGTPSKCVFCYDRVEQGKDPACVVSCPAHARIFGDLSDPKSEIARLIKDNPIFQLLVKAGTGPSVFYIPDPKSLKD
ncbi:4Fe-4S dicluster domain-containing protein [Paradesulfitobacterium aromaticivorans]